MTVQTDPFISVPAAPPPGPDVENGRVRVLVVEDQPGQAGALRANLEARGCSVLVAGDGPTAVELLASKDPDIILLDSRVLDPEGALERRQLLRRMRQSSAAPVILLAAPTGVADTVMGLRMGADDYVLKPVAIRELVARMQAILRRAGRSQGRETRLAV